MGLYERNLAPPLINLVRGKAAIQKQLRKIVPWAGFNDGEAARPR